MKWAIVTELQHRMFVIHKPETRKHLYQGFRYSQSINLIVYVETERTALDNKTNAHKHHLDNYNLSLWSSTRINMIHNILCFRNTSQRYFLHFSFRGREAFCLPHTLSLSFEHLLSTHKRFLVWHQYLAIVCGAVLHSSHAVHWHSILFYHNLLPESYWIICIIDKSMTFSNALCIVKVSLFHW